MGQAQGKEFPYRAEEQQLPATTWNVWSFHRGHHVKDETPVGLFQFQASSSTPMGKERIENLIKRTKTLRHPHILRYEDSIVLEEQIIMATETAQPLHTIQQEILESPAWIAWGLTHVASALEFLHVQGHLVHANLSIHSIFVTPSGEWKLAAFDLLSEEGPGHFLTTRQAQANALVPPPVPPEMQRGWKGPTVAFDAFQFGVLMQQVYHPLPLSASSPQTVRDMDTQSFLTALRPIFQSLTQDQPRSRPNLSKVLANPFFSNELTQVCEFMDSLALKEDGEKEIFFKQLSEQADRLPVRVCKFKLLPVLVQAVNYGSASSAALAPLLQMGKSLTPEEIGTRVAPHVAKWFASSDRQLRVNLLQKMNSFAEFLSPALVNDMVFPALLEGFQDTNPAMRELTIISVVPIITKIAQKTLDDVLLKSLARLQVDPKPGIRANATVCLSKIAAHLSPNRREQALIPAFSRALQDPFVHTRAAGVLAFAATQSYYGKDEVARRIIPVLSVCCIDSEERVRKNALNTIKAFVAKLELVAEHPDEEPNASQSASLFSWSGSVTSAISKFYPSKASSPTSPSSAPTAQKTPARQEEEEEEEEFHDVDELPSPISSSSAAVTESGWDEGWGSEEEEGEVFGESQDGGWNDSWKEDIPSPAPINPVQTPTARVVAPANDGWSDGWGDEDEANAPTNDGWGGEDEGWDDFDVPQAKPSRMEMAKERKNK